MTEQNDQTTSRAAGEDKVDLMGLVLALWKRRWLLVSIVSGFLVFAVAYLQTANYQYLIELQVTPSQGAASESMRGRLGGLSGLASLAGINIGGTDAVSNFDLYLESLMGRDVADYVSRDPLIMQTVFSSEWDAAAKNWRQPQSPLGPVKRGIKAVIGIPNYPWQAPDAARLQQFLGDVLRVDRKPRSPLAVIRTYTADPAFGIRLLAAVHRAADDRLRAQSLARTDEYVRYLTAQLELVTVAEHRQALAEALSEQEKVRMMTKASTPFAAEPFGSVTASLRPMRPRPVAVLAMAILAGGFVGVMSIVMLSIRQNQA